MDEMELTVSGMACRRCVREVTARLRDVAGVERVTADPTRSTVHLVGSMTRADVLAAFEGTSYRPVLRLA
jgi:copper chaperone CopZ